MRHGFSNYRINGSKGLSRMAGRIFPSRRVEMSALPGRTRPGQLVSQDKKERPGCVSVQSMSRHIQPVQRNSVRRQIFHTRANCSVHSRSAARQIFSENSARVEDQPHNSYGSSAPVASQCRTRTNERTPERSGSRNRRNVPERWGKKENGTLIHRIRLDVEPTNDVDVAPTRMIVHQSVL